MKKVIFIFITVFSFNTLFAQSQITVSNSSITGINSVFNKTVDNYLGGINKDSGTDLFISGTYPNSGYAIYRKNNSWKISQFNASIIFGNDILDFSNTDLFFHNSTEIKPPCEGQWQRISNSTLEGLTLLGACLGGEDNIIVENSSQNFICSNGKLKINFSYGGTLDNQNLYQVQLSDENGLFTSPTLIGSSNVSPINVDYPSNIISGALYKYRLITTNGGNTILSNEVILNSSFPSFYSVFIGGKACEGGSAQIEFAPNFSFQIDSVLLFHGNTKISTSSNGVFSLTNLTANDGGIYRAKYSKNGCLSNYSNDYSLSISNTSSEPWGENYSKAFCDEGNNYNVSLGIGWWNVKTVPGSTIEWYKDGNVITSNNSLDLGFYPVNSSNTGYYKFKVLNSSCLNSYVSDSFFVGISSVPIIMNTLPDSIQVCEGDYSNLNSTVVNQNGNLFQWQKDGNYLPNIATSNLVIPIYDYDEGFYKLVVKNPSCGLDSAVSSIVKIIKKDLPLTPILTLNGAFETFSNGYNITVQDSIKISVFPNNEFKYFIQPGGSTEFVLNDINDYYLKPWDQAASRGYRVKSINLDNCSSPYSNNIEIAFDTTGVHLTNCSVTDLSGRFYVISNLPFNVTPDANTKIYRKDIGFSPNINAYFIFRRLGKWRILKYTDTSMPGMPGPPSISVTEYFSSLSASMNVTCDMDWIKTSNQTTEILEFVGNCPLLQSFNNSINISETACGSFTIPNGNVVTGSGNYQYIINNSFRADSVITYQITINPLATASISGSSVLAAGQSYPVKIKFTGQKPYTVGFNGSTISNIQSDSIFVNVAPTVTTNYFLTSIQNLQCGNGTTSGSAYIIVDSNHPCLTVREIPVGSSPSGTYQAVQIVKSSANVGSPTLYKAGKSIELKSGFIAENGVVFKAEIGNCN